MKKLRSLTTAILLLLSLSAIAAGQPPATVLVIRMNGAERLWSLQELLNDRRSVAVTSYDENFKKVTTFRGIPLRELLKELPGALASGDATAAITATDGYISHIPMRLLLGECPNQSVAYLDVESAAYPWPKLNGVNIGPLRLQWVDSEKSGIRESQWTYSITAIDIVQTPASRFAAIRPSPDLAADSPVLEGFVTFQRVCFSCHTLNGAGDSQLGPDLNFPYSPVEYLGDERLLAYLREPQSLHLWPSAKMHPLERSTVSDSELNDLMLYFHHMSGRKTDFSREAAGK